MEKELQIAALIGAMTKSGRNYNDKDPYLLLEEGNVADIAKRAIEALHSLGYCIQVDLNHVEVEAVLTNESGE